MRSVKAIAAGSLFIIITSLLLQLAFIFIATFYSQLAQSYTILNEVSHYFRYIIGIPVFLLVMFIGGYITAYIAARQVILHCLVVATITVGSMIFITLENAELTLNGIIIFILSLISTSIGGIFWGRDNSRESITTYN